MEVVSVAPARVSHRQWLLPAAVAALFVGLQGMWQFLSLLAFFVQPETGFGDRVSFFWDVLLSGWGMYLAYAVVAVVSAVLVRHLCLTEPVQDLWTVIWRAAALLVPVCLVITFCVAVGTALIHDMPVFFFGFEVLG